MGLSGGFFERFGRHFSEVSHKRVVKGGNGAKRKGRDVCVHMRAHTHTCFGYLGWMLDQGWVNIFDRRAT